jgi:predicted nucleic acid-binding protein
MLVYCDSMILIYYLDLIGPFQVRAGNRLATLQSAGDQIAFSDLTRLECRVTPIRLGDALTLSKFDAFFGLPDLRCVPLTRAVYDRATHIRAIYNFRTADAIHLAAAVEHGCDVFLTNDARLIAYPDIVVEVLQ